MLENGALPDKENGAPPDKFGVLYTVYDIYISMVLPTGSMFWGYHTLVPAINSIFLQSVWVPLRII